MSTDGATAREHPDHGSRRLGPHAQRFASSLDFSLDAFQWRALGALESGRSVLVAAPTGAGKTVVGEFACALAVSSGTKAFYTTPIKALSNQKFRDLGEEHGEENVGLLTGDRSINGEAPIVVMTTEVLRNMIYERSPTLTDLRYVVLDEVHYLADRARGAVWEEVIVQLAGPVQIAALSATVSNAEEFGEWLGEVRPGGCEIVIEEDRPVPLRHHYFVNNEIHPTFVSSRKGQQQERTREQATRGRGGSPNPKVLMMERRAGRDTRGRGGRRTRGRTRLRWPSRPHTVEALADRRWLPAIVFVFSRNGCEKAVREVLAAGIRLTTKRDRGRISEIIDATVADIPTEDLAALGFATWRDSLLSGVAAHHAGLVPAFKEATEKAFQEGLLEVVFATETLALGINMPAKCVVIERLEKWDGERHVMLTPGEYTQLTGRAGRRGIDPVGHAVVLYQRDIDFRSVAGLVATRTYPLSSSFQPSYNMSVNLLRRHDLDHAERLLTASFAQFQADRSVAGLARRVAEIEEAVAGYARHLDCDRGDWGSYWAHREELAAAEREQADQRGSRREIAVREVIAALVPGEVVHWPGSARRGFAAVIGTKLTKGGTPLARVVTEDRRLLRLGPRDVQTPPEVVATVDLPKDGTPRQPAYRGKVADRLRELPDSLLDSVGPDDGDAAGDGDDDGDGDDASHADVMDIDVEALPHHARPVLQAVRDHPCHACPERDEHERWQRRTDELEEDAVRLRRRIDRQTGSLVRQLHRLLRVLAKLGYVDDEPQPTPAGLRLARIYGDVDLVVAECLREGLAEELNAAELAGFCSLFTYESRSDEPIIPPGYPTPRLTEVIPKAMMVADRVREEERGAGVRPLRDLDPGFVASAWRWARGEDLDAAIGDLEEMTGGDFVRSMKQVADLAGQLRDAADPAQAGELPTVAAQTVGHLRRGVVDA